jgi:hypothetical protein
VTEPAYSVVGQQHETRYDETAQRAVEGLTVTFSYGSPPVTGRVFVAGAVPDVDAIRNAIRDYVDRATQVQNLTD